MSGSGAPDRRGRTVVLVDTNGWFLPERSGTDLERAADALLGPVALRAPAEALAELERLAAGRVAGAEVALRLARRYPAEPAAGRGDAGIARAARRRGAWVLTGDRAFIARLRGVGVPVLAPRAEGRLEVVWPRLLAARAATVKTAPPVRRRPRPAGHSR